jgi:hypothetical protein
LACDEKHHHQYFWEEKKEKLDIRSYLSYPMKKLPPSPL